MEWIYDILGCKIATRGGCLHRPNASDLSPVTLSNNHLKILIWRTKMIFW